MTKDINGWVESSRQAITIGQQCESGNGSWKYDNPRYYRICTIIQGRKSKRELVCFFFPVARVANEERKDDGERKYLEDDAWSLLHNNLKM